MPKKPFRIAAVGSGGKTTLLYTLAREARERGLSVLLLPTTHMQLPEKDGVLTGRAEDVMEKLKNDELRCCGCTCRLPKTAHEPSAHALSPEIKKIGFPGLEIYEKAGAFADLVLVEADGSRRLPLKYPNETEPVDPGGHRISSSPSPAFPPSEKNLRNSVTGRNWPWKSLRKFLPGFLFCPPHRTGRPSQPRIWHFSRSPATSHRFAAVFLPLV
ncbi:MAG: selenium cofactor biosynthesis protein YqeC [Blautia sp.]